MAGQWSAGAVRQARIWTGAVAAAAVLVGAASVAGSFFRQELEETVALDGSFSRLVARADVGDIRVRVARAGEQPHLTRRLEWAFNRPTATQRVTAGAAEVETACPRAWIGAWCSVDLELVVPSGTAVQLRSSVGDVRVDGLSGAVSATTSVGDVFLTAVTGDQVSAHTSTGDVVVRTGGVDATVTAESDTGNVQVVSSSTVRRVVATTSAGDVQVAVPTGQSYAADVETAAGDRRVTIATDPAATRSITAHTSTGDVQVSAGAA